jgi:hypothetical protein
VLFGIMPTELIVLFLVIIAVIGVYYILKTAKTLLINTIVGFIILVIANMGFNMNVPYNIQVLLVVALGGIPGAVLVILLHAFQIAF